MRLFLIIATALVVTSSVAARQTSTVRIVIVDNFGALAAAETIKQLIDSEGGTTPNISLA